MKIRPEMKDHPLAISARELNDYVEQHGLTAACEKIGLKVEDLMYMAEQRGYRVLYSRHAININTTKPLELKLSDGDTMLLLSVLIPAYMDGIAIGWRAHQLATKS